jgi:lipopolysaccharide export system protein LptA
MLYKQSQPNQVRSVEANAQIITYFINQQLVRLEGNAHLVQGFDSFSGGILNYDIKKDKMDAGKSKNDTQRDKHPPNQHYP